MSYEKLSDLPAIISGKIQSLEADPRADEEDEVNVIIGLGKQQVRTGFVMLFNANLLALIEQYGLTMVDVKVVLAICEFMQFGNLLRMRQRTIAGRIGSARPTVTKSIQRLRGAGIIIDREDGSSFLNLNLLVKGNFKKLLRPRANGGFMEQLEASIKASKMLNHRVTMPIDPMDLKRKKEQIQDTEAE